MGKKKKVYGQVDATLHFVLMNMTICTSLKHDCVLNLYSLQDKGTAL